MTQYSVADCPCCDGPDSLEVVSVASCAVDADPTLATTNLYFRADGYCLDAPGGDPLTGTVTLSGAIECDPALSGTSVELLFNDGVLDSVNGAGGGTYTGVVGAVVSVECNPAAEGEVWVTSKGMNFVDGLLDTIGTTSETVTGCECCADECPCTDTVCGDDTVCGGSPPTSPPSTGLVGWYNGDDLNSLNDGDRVTLWADASSTGNDGNAAGAQRPVFRKAIVNGHSALQFNGTDQYLTMDEDYWPVPNTVFVVWYAIGFCDADGMTFLGTSDHGYDYALNRFFGDATGFPYVFVACSGGNANSDQAQCDNEWQVTAASTGDGSATFWNHLCEINTASGGPSAPGDIPGTYIGKGCNGVFDPMRGYIAEILVYDSKLVTADATFQDAACYLVNKYGL